MSDEMKVANAGKYCFRVLIMSEIDFEKIGLKVGLEIHQQLATR